jgi:porin
MIFKEEYGSENDQGLGVFFQFGWAPSNRNALTEYYGGGLVYKGLLPSRDEDMFGLGLASARFSDHFRAAEGIAGAEIGPSETAIELFYKALVGKHLSLQPDVQYIANPGGQYKDALVPGLRFEAVF